MRRGAKAMKGVLAFIIMCFSMAALATIEPGTPAPPEHETAGMKGNRLLIIVSAEFFTQGENLADLVALFFPVETTVVSTGDYAPRIDERFYDGFIYLGFDYYEAPKEGFVEDMEWTSKPVLWVHYHAWRLDRVALERKGLQIEDLHSSEFSVIEYNGAVPLSETDASWVGAHNPATVLSWLHDPESKAVQPGAVVSGNFGYVSYMPNLEGSTQELGAFLAAVRATLGNPPASTDPGPSYEDRVRTARDDVYRAGVHLPVFVTDSTNGAVGYDSDELHARLMRIKNAGAEWITISRILYQDGIYAHDIMEDPLLTASFDALGNIITDAHKLGLMVRLSVIVNLTEANRNPAHWRGFIRPKYPEQWWKNYRVIVLNAAKFARGNDVESLNVGAELTAMQPDEAQWRALIASVRESIGYRGLVGYQVNFDAVDELNWSNALDYLSIAAYWPLAEDRDPELSELIAAWKPIGQELASWVKRHPGIPLEFGEIGYVSQPFAGMYPYSWKAHKQGRQDLIEQLNCYLALEDFLRRHPEIAGVGIYASTAEDMEPGSVGYAPFGKPAGEVMERILKLR